MESEEAVIDDSIVSLTLGTYSAPDGGYHALQYFEEITLQSFELCGSGIPSLLALLSPNSTGRLQSVSNGQRGGDYADHDHCCFQVEGRAAEIDLSFSRNPSPPSVNEVFFFLLDLSLSEPVETRLSTRLSVRKV
ncbi:hypothetical protein AFLA_008849 [Aspergillus flavus NRRL3357]|nr:hypothetical protein AFLA_008849 [Aspergillus flavus NRRL3357]